MAARRRAFIIRRKCPLNVNAITADYVLTFFDVYLKNAPADSLTSLPAKYPEIHIELR
jgi:hypothetical protein